MKKIGVLLLSFILLLGVVACSKDEVKELTMETKAPLATEEEVAAGTDATADADTAAKPEGDFVGERPETEVDEAGNDVVKAIDFSLVDQNGNRHSLEDYKDKVVVLNFWQSWCGPCLAELPDFQRVFEQMGENKEDVVILGVSSPKNELNTRYFQEGLDQAGIKEFMEEKGLTYPSLMDFTGDLYANYGIMAFPTTYIIKPDGSLLGHVPGSMSEADLLNFIEQAKTAGQGSTDA